MIGGGWRGRRPLVFLFASALLAGTDARARHPPPSRADRIRRDNRAEVWDSLKGCSAEATSRHEYHVIEVEFPYSLGEEFSPRIKSSRDLDRKQYWCVARALRALRLEPIPRNEPFNTYDEVHDYALGQVQPLLPAALLPAWQRASNDPDRVRRELASMLPPEVKVGRDGCLRLQGPPLLAPALDAWLRQAAGPPILDSGGGFARGEQDHPLPGDWWNPAQAGIRRFGQGRQRHLLPGKARQRRGHVAPPPEAAMGRPPLESPRGGMGRGCPGRHRR